jgi:hypothetical protein
MNVSWRMWNMKITLQNNQEYDITDDQHKKIMEIIDKEKKPEFRKGQLVEVCSDNQTWMYGIYIEKTESYYSIKNEYAGKSFYTTHKYCRQPSWELLARTWVPDGAKWATVDKCFRITWWTYKPIKDGHKWINGGEGNYHIINDYTLDKKHFPKDFDWTKAIIEL